MHNLNELKKLLLERMRTPVREAFSYGIRHRIRHIHCDSMKHKVILHWITMNMPYAVPYPVWKRLPYGSTHPPYWKSWNLRFAHTHGTGNDRPYHQARDLDSCDTTHNISLPRDWLLDTRKWSCITFDKTINYVKRKKQTNKQTNKQTKSKTKQNKTNKQNKQTNKQKQNKIS